MDLLNEYDINRIYITNRTNCCSDRLVGARVYVGNIGSSNPNDYTFVGELNSNPQINFFNLNVSGRYVLIDRNNTNWLSLAEVQVFGTIVPTLNTNSAIRKQDELAIFPNPANDLLTIDLAKYRDASITYTIADVSGNERIKGQFNENHLDQEYIELDGLVNGYYILYVKPEGSRLMVHKFIVMKTY